MGLTTSSAKKISLSVKIDPEVDARIKRARKAAREVGLRFNVSKEVEEALLKSLAKIEKALKVQESEAKMDLLAGESQSQNNSQMNEQCPVCRDWFYADVEDHFHNRINIRTIGCCDACAEVEEQEGKV